MGSGTTGSAQWQAEFSCNEKVRAIYTSGNRSNKNQATKLLISALRKGDEDSRLALRQFLGLQATPRPTEIDIDRALISRVLLYVNGPNAIQVQTWLSSYEASPADSQDRSRLETTLRAFVTSNQQIEKMKCHVADCRSLITEIYAKCAELRSIREDNEKLRKLRHNTRKAPPGR